jgi:hypothetical protein
MTSEKSDRKSQSEPAVPSWALAASNPSAIIRDAIGVWA